jgi:hypothetical protein
MQHQVHACVDVNARERQENVARTQLKVFLREQSQRLLPQLLCKLFVVRGRVSLREFAVLEEEPTCT